MPLSLRTRALALGLPLLACVPESSTPQVPDETTTGEDTTGDTGDTTDAVDDTTAAPAPECGNGMIEGDEECDDGVTNSDLGPCTDACRLATCGDGLVHAGVEDCDDGNDVDDDECRNDCTLAGFCGDGVVEGDEECDEGRANDPGGTCKLDCTAAFCGDGEVQDGVEECDDGDDDNQDGCTELCAPPACGDGFVQPGNMELCDDGDGLEGDECNGDCLTWGLWFDTFNGPADNTDEINGIAADSAGNVIVAGATLVTGDSDDVWVRKYSPDGNVLWTQTYHGITSDIGYGVAVNANDDIFVGGSTFTFNDGRDTWLRRYTAAGATTWTQTFNGGANDDEEIYGVAVDPTGNVLVTGYTTTGAGHRDIWVRKYSAAGATTWTRTASGTGNNNDQGNGIAADADGNVIVTGYVWAGGDGRDIWVRKYDSGGNEEWTVTHNGPNGDNDEGNGVATDSAGNVVVAGFHDTNNDRDIWVRKYDPSGNEVWTATYDSPSNASDVGRGVSVDADDNITAVGSVFRGATSDNIWIRKYDADGNELWTNIYTTEGFLADVGTGVAHDPNGNIAVGGYETRSDLGEFRNAWVSRILQ